MSYQTCPECGYCVIGAWREEADGGYYHDRCLEAKRDRMRDAAPDMAEALQLCVNAFGGTYEAEKEAYEKSMAALAKAGLSA